VNLAEQHGKEGVLTNAYREYVEEAKLSDVKYVSANCSPERADDKEDTANMISMRRPGV
jgi:hypothetical protein